MMGQILGRAIAMVLGAALGLMVTAVVLPVETAAGTALVDRIAYGGGRLPQVGDLVIVENAVFTRCGDGGRLLLRVAGLPGDRVEAVTVAPGHLYLRSDLGGDHLDSRSEAVGQVRAQDVWGRVIWLGDRDF